MKAVSGMVSLFTLGQGSIVMNGGKLAFGKTLQMGLRVLLVDAISTGVSYGTSEICQAMGCPGSLTLVLSLLAGMGASAGVGSKVIGKNIEMGGLDEVDELIIKIENGEISLTDRIQKGNYGEMKMDKFFEKQGYDRIGTDRVKDINVSTHKGIDGVYYKPDGHPPYIIGEAKYGTAKLGTTKDGKQMSAKWIDKRLDNAVGKEMADKIRMEALLNPENVQSRLIQVTPKGKINMFILDSNAKKIK